MKSIDGHHLLISLHQLSEDLKQINFHRLEQVVWKVNKFCLCIKKKQNKTKTNKSKNNNNNSNSKQQQ